MLKSQMQKGSIYDTVEFLTSKDVKTEKRFNDKSFLFSFSFLGKKLYYKAELIEYNGREVLIYNSFSFYFNGLDKDPVDFNTIQKMTGDDGEINEWLEEQEGVYQLCTKMTFGAFTHHFINKLSEIFLKEQFKKATRSMSKKLYESRKEHYWSEAGIESYFELTEEGKYLVPNEEAFEILELNFKDTSKGKTLKEIMDSKFFVANDKHLLYMTQDNKIKNSFFNLSLSNISGEYLASICEEYKEE
jgi:hypothetical protein